MKEIACTRLAKCDPVDFAFWARAAEIQLKRDVYPAWRYYLPLGEMPLASYADISKLAPGSTHTLTVVDTIEDPRLAGYHSGVQAAGFAFGRALPNSRTIVHEADEMVADPYCNLWHFDEQTLMWYAREIADPVETETYVIEVNLFEERRLIEVPNFVYPRWFGMINHGGDGRFDHLDGCTRSFQVKAGYAITRDENNTVTNIYGSRLGEAKKGDPHSRTGRRFLTV